MAIRTLIGTRARSWYAATMGALAAPPMFAALAKPHDRVERRQQRARLDRSRKRGLRVKHGREIPPFDGDRFEFTGLDQLGEPLQGGPLRQSAVVDDVGSCCTSPNV